MPNENDRLTSQVAGIAKIIGDMGANIADAQKQFDVNYVDCLIRLARIAKELAGNDKAQTLLRQLAPSRYQFTETVLDFRADLSESMDMKGSLTLGAAFSAVTVNATLSLAYGYDYRSAARIKSTLHAVSHTNTDTLFLARMKEVDALTADAQEKKEAADAAQAAVDKADAVTKPSAEAKATAAKAEADKAAKAAAAAAMSEKTIKTAEEIQAAAKKLGGKPIDKQLRDIVVQFVSEAPTR